MRTHTRRVLIAAAILMAAGALPGCEVQLPEPADKGIARCPPGPVENYLAARMQQCWLDAPRGRWRILDRVLHYNTVVIEVEASSLADADEIARRLVEVHKDAWSEMLLYVRAESVPSPSRIRRIQWTPGGGYASLEFEGALDR